MGRRGGWPGRSGWFLHLLVATTVPACSASDPAKTDLDARADLSDNNPPPNDAFTISDRAPRPTVSDAPAPLPEVALPAQSIYDGDWKGTTALEKDVFLHFTRGYVTIQRFGYWGRGQGAPGHSCEGEGLTDTVLNAPVMSNSFNTVNSQSTFSYTVAGTFSSDLSLTGTVHFEWGPATGPGACVIKFDTTWTANKVPTLDLDGSWTGQTSDGKPFSLVVAHNRVASAAFDYAFPDACVPTRSFSGAPTYAQTIVAGNMYFLSTGLPFSFGLVSTFSSAKEASGILRMNYSDATMMCFGSAMRTVTLTRP